MNYQYTAMYTPTERYTDGCQQTNPVNALEEYSNLRDMWKLKIMDTQ